MTGGPPGSGRKRKYSTQDHNDHRPSPYSPANPNQHGYNYNQSRNGGGGNRGHNNNHRGGGGGPRRQNSRDFQNRQYHQQQQYQQQQQPPPSPRPPPPQRPSNASEMPPPASVNSSSPNLNLNANANANAKVTEGTAPIHTPAQSPQIAPQSTTSASPAAQVPVKEPTAMDVDNPPAKPEFYHWDYLTPGLLQEWNPTGFSALKTQFSRFVESRESNSLSMLMQEILKATVEDKLPVGESARFFTDCIESSSDALDVRQIFVQSAIAYDSEPLAGNFVALLKNLHPRVIPTELISMYLEPPSLVALGLVTPYFAKKAIKITTALVYKQRKHNLLREESEGFAKLITEFFTASYSAAAPLEVVNRTTGRVKGLIGAFELDPGRVLDVLLDTAACTVVSNARFFVRLLKSSAWWPKPIEAPANPPLNWEDLQKKKQRDADAWNESFFEKLRSEGISAFFENFRSDSRGNRVAAQLLGFKLRYYQRDDVNENAPDNLYVLAALLIKIGFIDIADLLPHISPDDAEMDKVRQEWQTKLLSSARGGKMNALMMAAALSDDSIPLSRGGSQRQPEKKDPQAEKKEEVKPKAHDNQKIALLKYLLAMGALPEAILILSKYPWLPMVDDAIAEHLERVIDQSISQYYNKIKQSLPKMGASKICEPTAKSAGGMNQFEQPKRKPMVTFVVNNLKTNTGDIEYRFFWEDWKDEVPVCNSAQDVAVLLQTLGSFLGYKLGRNQDLLSRVTRIGRSVFDHDHNEEERKIWINLLRTTLLPGVALADGNAGAVHDVWKILSVLPTTLRFSMYGEWLQIHSRRTPEMKAQTAKMEKETRDCLKKMSNTTIQEMARALSKIATSSPLTVMQVVLGQVEGYDNLIECVVNAARYFTEMGFDSVGFSVLSSMSNASKQRMKADGMLTSAWLQSLAQFCGKIYTRYYSKMDPQPVLEYVARQLKQHQSVELIVLQQLIQKMSGILPELNLNDRQLQGLAGGEVLRSEVLKLFRDRRAEDSPQTRDKLIQTLMKSNLAAEMLILIAQERQVSIYNTNGEYVPVKVLCTLYDDIHTVLHQYLELLKSGLTLEQYEQIIPSVGELIGKYGILPEVAWWISRPAIRAKMKRQASDGTGDVEMKDSTESGESVKSPWDPVLETVIEDIRPHFPDFVWKGMGLPFYVTFWQLSIYDIFVPMDAYQTEITRVGAEARNNESNRSDPSTAGQAARRQRAHELTKLHDQISAEFKTHIREHNDVRRRLGGEKDHWISSDASSRAVNESFFQQCIFPRSKLSPNDASFSAKFIREVHKMGTPGFYTIGIYEEIFNKGLGYTLFTCTTREAECFGRFIKEVFLDLAGWHKDKATYEKDAHGKDKGLPGFSHPQSGPYDWDMFRSICYRWHRALQTALLDCLRAKEYMHVRIGIIVLRQVQEVFPAIDWIGRILWDEVEKVSNNDKREDLKIAAKTLLGAIKKREKEWVTAAVFQGKADDPGRGTPNGKAGENSATAKPVGQETKPSTPAPSNNVSLPAPAKKADVEKEDGEVDDNDKQQSRKPAELSSKPSIESTTPAVTFTPPPASSQPVAAVATTSLPQKPPPPDHRRTREPPRQAQLQVHPAQQAREPVRTHSSTNSRAPTPRHDDDERRLDRPDMSRTLSSAIPNRPQPQPTSGGMQAFHHQLPERPLRHDGFDSRRDHRDSRMPDLRNGRTLDVRQDVRDLRSDVRQDTRPDMRLDTRLPEKPLEHRDSPRREHREPRDSRERHEGDRRTSGREMDFQRQPLPQDREERRPTRDDQHLVHEHAIREERNREREMRHEGRRDRIQMTTQPGFDMPRNVPTWEPMQQHASLEPERHSIPTLESAINETSTPPPTGPRWDGHRRQTSRQDMYAIDNSPTQRTSQSTTQHPFRTHDLQHQPRQTFGRDNRIDTRQGAGYFQVQPLLPHQDLNHGRLNPPTDMPGMNVPQGPRNRGMQPQTFQRPPPVSGMNIRGTATANQQIPPVRPPPLETRPPPVPRNDITAPRLPVSAPTTPSVETAGVHPERLRHLAEVTQPSPSAQLPAPASQITARLERSREPRHQDPVTSAPSLQPLPTPVLPRDTNTPTNAPTGPSRRTEDSEQRHQRRRMANVQSLLKQEGEGMVRRDRRRNGSGQNTPDLGRSSSTSLPAVMHRQDRDKERFQPSPQHQDELRRTSSSTALNMPQELRDARGQAERLTALGTAGEEGVSRSSSHRSRGHDRERRERDPERYERRDRDREAKSVSSKDSEQRDRDRERRRERREEEGSSRRESRRDEDGSGRERRERKHAREVVGDVTARGGRDDKRRRRGGENGWGQGQ